MKTAKSTVLKIVLVFDSLKCSKIINYCNRGCEVCQLQVSAYNLTR